MGRSISRLVAIAALLATAALVVLPAGAQDTDQIAYLGPGGSVWLVDLGSGEKVQLAGGEGFVELDWSPDGRWLVLVKEGVGGPGRGEIFVVDVEAGSTTKVADGYAPVWSDDGERILYVASFTTSEEGSEQSLGVVNVEDRTDTKLVTQRWVSGLWPIGRAVYSSDETLIAVYVAGLELEGHLVVVDGDGRTVWEIPDFVYSSDSFDWSPERDLLVYRDSGEPFMGGESPSLKVVRPQTQELVWSADQAGFWPRWSPDGESIASLTWEEGGGFRVTIVDALEGGLVLQSERAFDDLWNSELSWSPDGTSLLLTAAQNDSRQVLIMDRDGESHPVAEGKDPEARWSPDGTRLALARGEEGDREIVVVQADGSDLRKVADGTAPRWRPERAPVSGRAPLCSLPILGSSAILLAAIRRLLVPG